jgi:iron complex outermembrane receptor protein
MNVKLAAANNLAFGVDARFLGGTSYNYPVGSWNKNDLGAYIHDELVLGRRWILSAGVRADKDSQFGWEASPQAGIVFKAGEDTSLRFSTAKAFRSPAINELYLFPPSNPSLQPERVWNLEFGVDQAVGRNLFLTAAVFRMKGTNLIETALNPGGYPPYKFQNTGKFMFYGTEIGLRAVPFRSLTAGVSYSYLDAGDLTKGRPGSKIDADIRWTSGPFRAFLNGQHVSHYYAADKRALPIPSYFLLNARVEFSIRRNLGVFADVNNITSEDYKIYADLAGQAAGLYQMPGRNVHFGFRTGF